MVESWMKPMLCTPVDDVPIGDYALEPKLDGWRCVMHHTGRGVIAAAGRDSSDYSGRLPYIETELASCLPPDTCVDGELVGNDWGDVQSVMTMGGPHIPTMKNGGLRYVVFDVLRCDGQDTRSLPWRERRAILDSANLDSAVYVSRTDVFDATPRALQVALATGFEGVVCKQRDSVYVNGRSPLWPKIKAEWTCEAVVTAWERGSGSNAARLGALHVTLLADDGTTKVGSDGKPVTTKVGGGFTDAMRDEFAKARVPNVPAPWNGAVIEIKHNGEMASGKVRHPTFVRRRDDRNAPAPRPRRAPAVARTPAPGAWVRNYGAMGDAKLQGCIRELKAGRGDAVNRVNQKGGDVNFNLARAIEAAVAKGIPVP